MNSILLVEDETVICTAFVRTLEGLGFKVEVAPDVESGLSCAEAAQFGAILVEFNVRSERAHARAGNGLQLVCQLRSSDIVGPVLMSTAMEGEFYESASLNAGADDFILKTTSIPSLVSRLRAHIRGHQQRLCRKADREKVSI